MLYRIDGYAVRARLAKLQKALASISCGFRSARSGRRALHQCEINCSVALPRKLTDV